MQNQSLYKVYCKTFKMAQQLTNTGFITKSPNHPFLGFRCRPKYRTPEGKALRNKVAHQIKMQRQSK